MPAASGYFPVTAQNMAEGRRRRQRTLIRCPQLREVVIDRLKHDWSPEQIAGRLKVDGIAPVTVSHETIYKFIYSKVAKRWNYAGYYPPDAGNVSRDTRAKHVATPFQIPLQSSTGQTASMNEKNSGIGRAIL